MDLDNKRAILGWSLYDWANSAFATTVMAGFFPVFFKEYWCTGVDATVSTARLGLANSITGIFIVLTAAIMGSIADKGTARKRFLMFFAFMGVVMTSGLYFLSKGDWFSAVLIYVIASIGWTGGNIFYDSLITAVASERRMDFVSSLGFSLGYLGGGLLFAFNVWMTLNPAMFGFSNAASAVRFSFLSVALWWAFFSIPLFLFVEEIRSKDSVSGADMIKAGILQLTGTFQRIRRLKQVFLFLAGYWLYIDGVDTIIRMAVDYGISIGFESRDLILALLITQFVGFPSAIGFGFLGNYMGTRRAIFLAIIIYLFITIWGTMMQSKTEFYILAIIIGMVQGGIQALSRSVYTRIIPEEKPAEYFGFYNMVGKFAVVIGPVLMGGVGLMTRAMGYPSNTASRAGIASISVLFLLGGILFYFVKEERVKE